MTIRAYCRAVLLLVLLLNLFSGCSSDDPASPTNPDRDVERVAVEVVTVVGADEYIKHRYFKLEVPSSKSDDEEKQRLARRIELSSIRVFKRMGPGQFGPGDVANVAAYIDNGGPLGWADIDFSQPRFYGTRWRRVTDFEGSLDWEGVLKYIALKKSQEPEDVLAVAYKVVDSNGNLIAQVGDDPAQNLATQPDVWLDGQDLYYRMMLLKAPDSEVDERTSSLVIRNIYSLGVSSIDANTFDLRIEALNQFPDLDLAAEGVSWVRLFGLDIEDMSRNPGHDGLVDIHNSMIFDLYRGLLKFPLDNPQPFAAEPEQYLQYVTPEEYPWSGSYLEQNLVPEIYQFDTPPANLVRYRKFQIVTTHMAYRYVGAAPAAVSLDRWDWFWASAPVPHLDGNYQAATLDYRRFDSADRVATLRWFAPRERTLRRYLNPTLTGSAADETQPTLDLYLRTENSSWHAESWGGISTAVDRVGADLNGYQKIEVWVNDHQPEPALRSGRLHVDYGYISEDGFWPQYQGAPQYGTVEREDRNSDGIWIAEEDTGLDDLGLAGPQRFDPGYEIDGDQPYPMINGTAGNLREDDEDLNGNGRMDIESGYFTNTIDLMLTEPDIDVVQDYEHVESLVANRIAWRKYSLLLGHSLPISGAVEPDGARITHLRIWYENDEPGAPNTAHLQISGLRFVK